MYIGKQNSEQQKGDKYGKMETDWSVLRYERRRKREREKTC